MNTELIEKVTQIVERAGGRDGIEAVDVTLAGAGNNRVLRIFIDKPEGVTHADCERISQYVGTVLDAEDLIPGGSYRLEVSSPGVERRLTRPRDFERFIGKKLKVVLRAPLDGADARKLWEGTLATFDGDAITLRPAKGDPVKIPLSQVDRANLKFEW